MVNLSPDVHPHRPRARLWWTLRSYPQALENSPSHHSPAASVGLESGPSTCRGRSLLIRLESRRHQLHAVASSWLRGARSRVEFSMCRQLSSCNKVGFMEHRHPLSESIEVDIQFVKQYPNMRDVKRGSPGTAPRTWGRRHRILRGSRASRSPSPM